MQPANDLLPQEQIFNPLRDQFLPALDAVVGRVIQHGFLHVDIECFVFADHVGISCFISLLVVMVHAHVLRRQQSIRGRVFNEVFCYKGNDGCVFGNEHLIFQHVVFEDHRADHIVPIVVPRFRFFDVSHFNHPPLHVHSHKS